MVWDMMVRNGMGWQEMVWDDRKEIDWHGSVCKNGERQFSKNLTQLVTD